MTAHSANDEGKGLGIFRTPLEYDIKYFRFLTWKLEKAMRYLSYIIKLSDYFQPYAAHLQTLISSIDRYMQLAEAGAYYTDCYLEHTVGCIIEHLEAAKDELLAERFYRAYGHIEIAMRTASTAGSSLDNLPDNEAAIFSYVSTVGYFPNSNGDVPEDYEIIREPHMPVIEFSGLIVR